MSRHFRGSLQVFQKDNLEFFLNKNEETGGFCGNFRSDAAVEKRFFYTESLNPF